MTRPWIWNHPLLEAAPDDVRRAIADAFEVRAVSAGEVLLEQGAPGGQLLIIEAGFAEVLVDGDQRLVTLLGTGALLGEVALLCGTGHKASVVAATDMVVYRLAASAARRLVETQPAFALAVGRVAALRMARAEPATARPGIICVVHRGEYAEAIRQMHRDVPNLPATASLVAADLDRIAADSPLAACRALAHAMQGAHTLVVWARVDGPGFERAVRNADRIILMADGGPSDLTPLIERLLGASTHAAAELTVAMPAGESASGLPGQWGHERRIEWWRLASEAVAEEVLRAFDRRGTARRVLRDSVIFGGLSPACRLDVEFNLRPVQIESGQTLYAEGASAESLYMVVSGRMSEVSAEGARTDYPAGFVLGDDGLAGAGVYRSAAVARRDSTLAALSVERLRALYVRHPELRIALAEQATAGRAEARTEAMADRASITIILPDRHPAWRDRIARLQSVLGGPRRCRIVDRATVTDALGEQAVSAGAGSPADYALRTWLSRLEDEHRYLLYVSDADDLVWSARCIGQTDHLMVFARGADDPRALTTIGCGRRRELALWWPEDGRPSGTAGWLDRDPELAWHHVREGNFDDLGRMTRRLLGKACGMVFGGASARCIAHLGVAAGMRAAGLPIDTAVATSSGSMIAGVLALGLDADETLDRSLEAATGFKIGLRNLGPPIAALFSGKVATELAQKTFGDALLEDLLMPLKITTIDLRTGETYVLDRGPIWLASRAACAVPGMWPPIAVDGRLYIDGGLVDNFPYTALEGECADGLTLISNLDAGYSVPYADAPDYGAVLSGWKVAWDKLMRRDVRYPSMIGTMIDSLVVNSRASSVTLTDRADPRRVVISRPEIPKLDFFGLKRGPMVDELMQVAERDTTAVLEEWMRQQRFDPAYSTRLPALVDSTSSGDLRAAG